MNDAHDHPVFAVERINPPEELPATLYCGDWGDQKPDIQKELETVLRAWAKNHYLWGSEFSAQQTAESILYPFTKDPDWGVCWHCNRANLLLTVSSNGRPGTQRWCRRCTDTYEAR